MRIALAQLNFKIGAFKSNTQKIISAINSAKEQKRLLHGLVDSLKIGGTLVYSVCTIEEEETSGIIKNFLKAHDNFEVLSPEPLLHKFYKKYVTQDKEIFIVPGNPDKIDGFYACLLKKIR